MTVSPVAAASVQSAIALAAKRTGVDFDYLLGQAKLESGLNASARAGTSSAAGLYQFLDQSWLSVVKKHGAEHGLSWAADAIGTGANGKPSVADPATRRAILSLRDDPQVASAMAAASASDHAQALQGTLGRSATGTDLYMAHFLGLAGATRFLSTMQANPGANGAAMFPAAASANRNVFFDGGGNARSLSAIYARFADKLGAAASGGSAAPTMQYAAQALDTGDGATVVTGNGESASAALAWARQMTGSGTTDAALDAGQANRMTYASLMRPTPDTARLAYLMLSQMSA